MSSPQSPDQVTAQNDDRYRDLKRIHQRLLRDWRRGGAPCIVCAKRVANDRDHLPPKVLFPSASRSHDSEFFTFPVCKHCNNSSSDEDFLFSVLLSLRLNQDSILHNREQSDPDLLALDRQMQMHLHDPKKGRHRLNLLRSFMEGDEAIDLTRLPINQTLTKIVKSIYWLHTGGDILERHRPGWWIRADVDTSKDLFIEKHLKTTHADLHWGDRFIAHYTVGRPDNGVGGVISCSLHFYTKRRVGEGASWLVMASPSLTSVEGRCLYEMSMDVWGSSTIEP